MKYKTFDHMNCALAQTLSVIGDRWTLLILRDVFFGKRRFGQFEKSLGIARNILSARLSRLQSEGILERRPAEDGAHDEYVLTEAGLALQPVLLAMTHWGDRYRPHPAGPRRVFVDRDSGRPIRPMSVLAEDGRVLGPREVRATPGPGADHETPGEREREAGR